MKKIMSSILVVVLSMVFVSISNAQNPNLTVKRSLNIEYNSRTQLDDSGLPKSGVKDVYKMDLSIVDTIGMRGTIEHLPPIFGTWVGSEKQQSNLTYALDLVLKNPANLSQERSVGRLTGVVPIDSSGKYQYDSGNLRMAVNATGKARGFESAFRGIAAAKPPTTRSYLESAKKSAITLQRQYGGKNVNLVVTNYDQMSLEGLTLAAGPVETYPEAKVNGKMLFDYDRSAWYFYNTTMNYQTKDGVSHSDTLSGNIKWVESSNRETTGEGEYQFDVRVNEPQETPESAAFQTVDDESAFFEVDTSLPALVGTAKYIDSFSGESVVGSKVNIDLVGSNLNKQQVVNLTKLIWLVSVVPMNAE